MYGLTRKRSFVVDDEAQFFQLFAVRKRVAAQRGAERDMCIALLRDYVKREIPRLSACRSFREESRNRRLVMRLNYMGLHDLALKLLALKKG